MRKVIMPVVEYSVGKVKLTSTNLLIKDTQDMQELEYWESRLTQAKQPFSVTYKRLKGKVYYSIYTDLSTKGSIFK